MDGLACLAGWVDRIVAAAALTPVTAYALRLCLEEAVANIVMHGTPAGAAAASIAITAAITPATLTVTIEDACAAFDPTAGLPPRVATGRVGGHGLRLMRQYARTLTYCRLGERNRLTLTLPRDAA